MSKKILERDVVEYCRKRVAAYGGEMRKVKWEGRRSAPDWLIMLPGARPGVVGRHFYCEFKAPGKHPTDAQYREIYRMQNAGMLVCVFASFASVDELLPL